MKFETLKAGDFILDGDFNERSMPVKGEKSSITITLVGDSEYAITEIHGIEAEIIEVLTKEQLRAIWRILTV